MATSWAGRRRANSKDFPFDAIEPELEEAWGSTRSEETPRWEEIREATRDAFQRARGRDEE